MQSGLVLQKEELLLILFISSKASSEDMHVRNVQPKCLTGSFVSLVSMFIRGSRKRRKKICQHQCWWFCHSEPYPLSSLVFVQKQRQVGGSTPYPLSNCLSTRVHGAKASLKKRGADSARWCSHAKMDHVPAPTLNAELDLPYVQQQL